MSNQMFLKSKTYGTSLNKDGAKPGGPTVPGEGIDHYKKLFSFSKCLCVLTGASSAQGGV